jgi:hypothetical protein
MRTGTKDANISIRRNYMRSKDEYSWPLIVATAILLYTEADHTRNYTEQTRIPTTGQNFTVVKSSSGKQVSSF